MAFSHFHTAFYCTTIRRIAVQGRISSIFSISKFRIILAVDVQVFIVTLQFVSVFNMCVTHGETFLSDTKSYDSLYYEIIRATADFIKLSDYGTV